jgi:hypothetical protein
MSYRLSAVPRRRRLCGKVETHDNGEDLAPDVVSVGERIVICAGGTWNTPSKRDSGGDATGSSLWLTHRSLARLLGVQSADSDTGSVSINHLPLADLTSFPAAEPIAFGKVLATRVGTVSPTVSVLPAI